MISKRAWHWQPIKNASPWNQTCIQMTIDIVYLKESISLKMETIVNVREDYVDQKITFFFSLKMCTNCGAFTTHI